MGNGFQSVAPPPFLAMAHRILHDSRQCHKASWRYMLALYLNQTRTVDKTVALAAQDV